MNTFYKNIIAATALALLSGCSGMNFSGNATLTDAEMQAVMVAEVKPATIPMIPEMKPVVPLPMLPRMKPLLIEKSTVQIPNGRAAPLVAVSVRDLSKPLIMAEMNYTAKQEYCLAANIYFEARSETMDGMIAVGLVTVNRVMSNRYPDTICKVVWQNGKTKSGRRVAQFSWTLDGKSDTPWNRRAWKVAIVIAEIVLNDYTTAEYDFTNGALWYHADYVKPKWRHNLNHTVTVGRHIFYTSL